MLWSILPSILVIAAMFVVSYPALWIIRFKQKGKRSPLSQNLLSSPGETLIKKIEDLSDLITESLVIVIIVPFSVYSSYLFQLIKDPEHAPFLLFLLIVVGLVFIVVMIRRLVKLFEKRGHYRLGLDAERAVGEELNQLMIEGFRVFHDFPSENFNIDHIAIGPNGVFAVETKGRAKPDNGRGKADALIVFDGKRLNFPGWFETEPLNQAKRQAEWLSKWLSSAVGETVAVAGVVVLPGWFIERKGAGDVRVLSGKEIYHLKKMNFSRLSPELVQRIAHQVEQRCRNVEPSAYKKKRKKS